MEIEMIMLYGFSAILVVLVSLMEWFFWSSFKTLKAKGISVKEPIVMHIGGLLIGLLLIGSAIMTTNPPKELIKIAAMFIVYGWGGSSVVIGTMLPRR